MSAEIEAKRTALLKRLENLRLGNRRIRFSGQVFQTGHHSLEHLLFVGIKAIVSKISSAPAHRWPADAAILSAANVWVPMTADQTLSLIIAIADRKDTGRRRVRELKDALNAATTIAQLEALDLATGWPADDEQETGDE